MVSDNEDVQIAGGPGGLHYPPAPVPPVPAEQPPPLPQPPPPQPTPPTTQPGQPREPLPDPATWTGGEVNQSLIQGLIADGYPSETVFAWARQINFHLAQTGRGTVPTEPPTVPAPPTTVPATVEEENPEPDSEFEGGEEPTEDDWKQWELAANASLSGERVLQSADATKPGTIIGWPYKGTHDPSNLPPKSRVWQSENAIDVFLFPGTPVIAVKDGVVSATLGYGLMEAGTGRYAGNRLHVIHAGGMISWYAHMVELVAKKGQHVKKGDILGYSGIANGVPHLHFAVNPPFNPVAFSTDCYRLSGRKTPPTITAGGVTVTVMVPDTSSELPHTVTAAWQGLLNTLGHSIPSVARRIDANRKKLNSLI